jgi:hypothetical protein
LYIEQKLQKHRQDIIDKYGSSKVPTPTLTHMAKQSPTYSSSKQSAAPVHINFDDELSQVVHV